MKYGQKWREHRQAFHQSFDHDAVSQFHPTHLKETQALLLNLLGAPASFSSHIKRYAFASFIHPGTR